MFARQGIRTASRFGVRPIGLRHASTSSITTKVTGFFDCAAYWTKVAGEVAKQVYLKEGLAPPKTTEFKQVYDDAINQGLSFIKNPKGYSSSLVRSSQNFTTNDIVKYTSYLLQILGFFALGEIVGRRQVVGYPKYGPSAEATD